MARRMQTYAIRLAVEGGGQVKAELVSVGQSGEQSLKRIESAGDRASGGLKGLGRQAELLRTGIRTLGGALIGAATIGGLGALIDRSISAADAIGKTADKIGVGVEALQELRFAAKASGVEQQTLDMALQRFTRRAAEAAQGTGEAKDALAQLGITLRDQSGNLRRSEDLLADVADAFARIEDPAERVRLAFKLFDSEGVSLVNLLRDGSGALVFVPGHQPGEMFVLLDDSAAINRRLVPLDRVGNTLHLAAVARGGDAGNSKPEAIEFAGNDLRPYAPVHFAASGSFGSDITLTWVRRTRVGGDLQDGFGTVLLAEDAEEYELEIIGPDDDVRRTATGLTSLSFTYTTAMQAVDFPEGYPASAFVVYQISAQVGRGFAARLDFPDAPQFATLGEDIAEGQAGSGTSNFPANTVMAQRYTGIAGQVLSASAYLGSSASGNMRIGLYADNAGEPGALIAITEDKAFTATSAGYWEELTFTSPPTTVSGARYWLACHTDASVNSRGSDGSNQNDARRMIAQSYAGSLPDPFGSGSSYSNTRGMKMLVWTNP